MWILDGYNLLFRLPEIRGSFEGRRELLIDALIERFPRRAMIIVFDGRIPPPDHERRHIAHIEVVYTAAGVTADSWIVEKIQNSPHPRRLRVVTADRGLARLASCSGAQVEDPDSWIEILLQREQPLPRVRLGRSALEYQELFQQRLERLLRGESLED
jgi:predicted RNA-binding protein with PIN domain